MCALGRGSASGKLQTVFERLSGLRILSSTKNNGLGPNNSFKPNLLRYGKGMAGKACHAFASTTQVGLIQALGRRGSSTATERALVYVSFQTPYLCIDRVGFIPGWLLCGHLRAVPRAHSTRKLSLAM